MSRPASRLTPLVVLALLAALAAPVASQEASSTTEDPGTLVQPGSATGSAPFVDAAGERLGTIMIREIDDPFTGFEPNRPPAEGQRYVLLTVTFDAAEDNAFATDPNRVQLQDSAGYLYSPATVSRPADAPMPDLRSQTLAPFDRVSGVIGYAVPEGAVISRIVYRGDGSRYIVVVHPGPSGPVALGEAASFTSAESDQLGTVSVWDAADPFTGFEPSRPPAEGHRLVLLTLAFEASEDRAMMAEPRSVHIVDADGFVHRPATVFRPAGELMQELDRQPLSPGDRVSGVIGYVVPEGAVLREVLYASESNRILPIADLATDG